MVSHPTRSFLNTVFIVIGALLIGQMLHVTLVKGTQPIFAVNQLVKVVAGIALIAAGRYVYNPVDEAERRYQMRENQKTQDSDDFDPEMSPIGEDIDHADAAREEE